MDIRYIAWAGYDLLGAVISTGVQGPGVPSLDAKVQGTKKVVAKEISPSMRGRMQIQNSPRIVQDDRRPFPGPTNI